MPKNNFAPIESIIGVAKRGGMFILVDDEKRENEGDLVISASDTSPKNINFMAKHGRGLICLAMDSHQAKKLNLTLMSPVNQSRNKTAFTVSIEAKKGISTGISARDRSRTIKIASKNNVNKNEIVSPGHVFPIIAKDGGVLVRAGHTEASVDISKLARKKNSAVICEIMNEDGSMARRDDLMKFASTHEMKIGTIADLIHYRALKEKSVHLEYSKPVEIDGLKFELSAWRDSIFDNLHLTFIKGDLSSSDAPLVRVHIPNTLHDLIGVEGFGKRLNLENALKRIGKEECGVLLLIGNYQDANEVMHDLMGTKSQVKPETKTVGIGSQILKELGLQKIKLLGTPVKYPSLSGFDLEVTGFEQ